MGRKENTREHYREEKKREKNRYWAWNEHGSLIKNPHVACQCLTLWRTLDLCGVRIHIEGGGGGETHLQLNQLDRYEIRRTYSSSVCEKFPWRQKSSMWPCVIQAQAVVGPVAGDLSIASLLGLVYVLLLFLSHLTTGLINRLFKRVQGPSNKVCGAFILQHQ